LVSLLYDDFEPGAAPTRGDLEAHVRACATCLAEFEALGGVRAQLAAWRAPDVELGFAVVRRDSSPGNTFALPRLRAVVEGIGVAAAARRRGAGRALMAGAEELARTWGAAAVALDVQSFNGDAESFYRSLGYRAITTRMAKRL
jgi:ribosomal protein S18 acetylase RimI-like enzyme